MKVNRDNYDAMKELIDEGDLKLEELRSKFWAKVGRHTTLNDDQLTAAAAAQEDDDDDELCEHIAKIEAEGYEFDIAA